MTFRNRNKNNACYSLNFVLYEMFYKSQKKTLMHIFSKEIGNIILLLKSKFKEFKSTDIYREQFI